MSTRDLGTANPKFVTYKATATAPACCVHLWPLLSLPRWSWAWCRSSVQSQVLWLFFLGKSPRKTMTLYTNMIQI